MGQRYIMPSTTSYYLFHITHDKNTTKVYKFDTDNLCLIFKYILKKWGKNYLKFIKYVQQIDPLIAGNIPDSILSYFTNFDNMEIDIVDMIYKISTQDLLKLFKILFCASRKNRWSDDYKVKNMANLICNIDYIYLRKINVKPDDDTIHLRCEYCKYDEYKTCESLKFSDIDSYENDTCYDGEYFNIVCKISDIETISPYSKLDIDEFLIRINMIL